MYEQYSHKIEDINRDKAVKYLEKNEHNRYLNSRTVDRYAQQMTRGEWQVNGEPIMFSEAGNLLNGQHRLSAIVAADKTIAIPVFRGVEESAIKTIDTGKPRSLADHLKIHGYRADTGMGLTVIAATIRIVFDFDEQGFYSQRKVKITPTDAIKFLGDNKDLFDSAKFLYDHRTKSPVPVSVLVALHYLFRKINFEKADVFMEKFFSGENLNKSSPILTLRHKLDFSTQGRHQGYVQRRMCVALIIQAFEAFLHDDLLVEGSLVYKPESDVILPE